MKKLTLIVLMLFTVLSYAQGEQLYADGTATNQDGNSFEWIKYGTQDWAIENAEVVNYRDGTPIPQVTDQTEWANLTTGAWCYFENDPNKGVLYNWYAVMGIHDAASLSDATLRKEFALEGWHVPSFDEWVILQEFLISNGYNYDGTPTGNKIAKSMASTTGWLNSTTLGTPGNNQSTNNSSGFNAYPKGYRWGFVGNGFSAEGVSAVFWSTTDYSSSNANFFDIGNYREYVFTSGDFYYKVNGNSVRLVKDATSLSTTDFSNSIIIYPNPVKNILTIDGLVVQDVVIYSVLGKEVLKISNLNTIDVSSLSKGVYFIKVSDGINASTKKFIKN
jgi:uncharacterized protein (TIGR02145 family)